MVVGTSGVLVSEPSVGTGVAREGERRRTRESVMSDNKDVEFVEG